jgi:ketosteroid isomerase-like protein
MHIKPDQPGGDGLAGFDRDQGSWRGERHDRTIDQPTTMRRTMVKVEMLRDKAIAILTPDGRLESSDFEAVAREVDPLIEDRGMLNGLMIRASHFPGWADLGALVSHIRFVRDHHRKVRRVAVVSDSQALKVLPALAQHFVGAEIRHFGADQAEQALSWLEPQDALPSLDDATSDGQPCLKRLYASFNTHDVEGALATMHADVVWDGEMEGAVYGRDGVRAYLTRQWAAIDTRAEPIRFHPETDGRVRVDVHLTARDRDGNMLIDKTGSHLFRVRDGLIRRFDVGSDN